MAYLSVKDGKSETFKYVSQCVYANKILIVFATQSDFHGKCNIQASQNVYCTCLCLYIRIYPH